MRWAVAIVLVLASCGGTSHPHEDGPPPVYPGTLVAADQLCSPAPLGRAFAIEQRVRTEYPEGAQEFRAVLQKTWNELVLVGFGPHGGRGFALTLRGSEVTWESHLPEELPFPPEFMLRDVERVWFLGLDAPQEDGEHRLERDGEEIVERWENGRLLERTFRRLDGEPQGLLRATYEGGLGGDAPPPRVTFENPWFGYTLVLTTLSHQLIEEDLPLDQGPCAAHPVTDHATTDDTAIDDTATDDTATDDTATDDDSVQGDDSTP
ncbi:MAG: DUF3261 domain-containing protein [Sandaracinaceae bacterium]